MHNELTIRMVLQKTKRTYHIHCANYQNDIVDNSNRSIIDTVLTMKNGVVDKSNRPIIENMFSIRRVLQTNQTDLSYTIYSLLEWYCRQVKQTYHRQYVLYQNGIINKSDRPIIYNMLSIRIVLQKIKQIYHRHCVNYQNGIVDKSNRPIIDVVLTIRTVLQINQADLSQPKCSLLERYCRQIQQTYHIHRINYQNGIVDKSDRPIIGTVLTIRTVLSTNQTDLLQTLC